MNLYVALSAVLVFNLIVTSIFILKIETHSGKMLITLLLSTTGVGVLFLFYGLTKNDSLLDVALVLVLLNSVTVIVFAKRLQYKGGFSE
jgi:multisubunit Na+/H+ antiporter MnhF subunit